ncbi:unnamed protein product, partial [Rotaria magnacalcarata]
YEEIRTIRLVYEEIRTIRLM